MEKNINLAIILLCAELIFIYYGMYRALYRNTSSNIHTTTIDKTNSYYSLIAIIILLITITIWIIIPQLSEQYSTVIDSTEYLAKYGSNIENIAIDGIIRIIATLGTILTNISLLLIPNYLIYKISKVCKGNTIGILTSIFISLLPLVFIGSVMFTSLVMCILSFILILKLNPQKRTSILITSGIGYLLLVVALSVIKISGLNDTTQINSSNVISFICAYFPGWYNLSGVFNMSKINMFQSFIAEMFSALPFKNTIASLLGYNYSIYLDNGGFIYNNDLHSQIIPFIGYTFYYFSGLSLLFSFYISYYAVIFGRKMNASSELWNTILYGFIMLTLAVSLAIYNLVILIQSILNPILFLIVIKSFTKIGDKND